MSGNTQATKIAALAQAVLADRQIESADALELLKVDGNERYDLLYWANRIRLNRFGNKISLCSVASAQTGRCSEDCRFCAQSSHYPTTTEPQRRTAAELLAVADSAADSGADCFGIVSSGLAPNDDQIDRLAPIITHMAASSSTICSASLGTLTPSQAQRLRGLGLTRYHHNLETSERFFPQVVTTHSYADKVATVRAVRRAGMQVCCGGIIGLGETLEDRVDLALTLRRLDVDRVPLNFLHPVPGTPLAAQPLVSPMTALQTIAVFRFLLPDKHIMVAGGRENCLRDLQSWIFFAGASGCMIGNYLTTAGRPVEQDLQMLADLDLPTTTPKQ